MSTINCPNCGSVSPTGAIFCDNCGSDLRNLDKGPTPSPPTVAASSADTLICQSCGHENLSSSAFCENCGAQLEPPVQQVVPAQPQNMSDASITPVPQSESEQEVVADSQKGVPSVPQASPSSRRLVIQNTNTSLPIMDKPVITLGREDPVSGIFPEVDLTPYGAQESGVGRQHAKILIQGGETYIEDLNSVNGTLVNKQKIPPNQPVQINNGDEIRLGLLIIHYYTD